tara:strand:- start:504 stop:1676 length:1173 start_codon:yes stop_codon:yes gene_type:complete
MHPERPGRKSPPSIRNEGRHDFSATLSHDEFARLDFSMTSNFYVSQNLYPGIISAWTKRQKNIFEKKIGRAPKRRQEIRPFMKTDPIWQIWSSLKRNNQEMSYQTRGEVIARQIDIISKKSNKNKKPYSKISLNPNLTIPKYITTVDIHCMPGGYNSDDGKGFYSGFNYDTASLFLATGGELGKWNDGAGWSNVAFIKQKLPDFKPKKILDLGCSVGHSTLPLKQAWPDAKVFAIDACAPLLRYAYIRSNELKVKINFSQQNASSTEFPSNTFDLIVSTMFMHEIPQKPLLQIGKEIFRLLKPGGIMLHNEQPQYHQQPIAEQFFREWDTFYNNEPMRCAFRDMDLKSWITKSGFNIEQFSTSMAPGARKTKRGIKTSKNGFWFMIYSKK